MLHLTSQTRDSLFQLWGTVTDVSPGIIRIAGISQSAGIGNEVSLMTPDGPVHGEILNVSDNRATALLFRDSDAIRIGDRVNIERDARVTPGDHWLGRIVNYRGEVVGDALRCPFHFWTFAVDGTVRDVPWLDAPPSKNQIVRRRS